MIDRRAYHRDYYRRNAVKRRAQRIASSRGITRDWPYFTRPDPEAMRRYHEERRCPSNTSRA